MRSLARLHTVIALFTLGVLVVGLAGCSSDKPNAPSPISSTSTGGEATPVPSVTVSDPLDVSSYITAPCSVLTQDQAANFGATGPGSANSANFPSCDWQTEKSTNFAVGFNNKQAQGLNGIYRLHQTTGQYEYFQPTTVSGYPAVANNLTSQGLPNGDCDMMVAVNDKIILDASILTSHTGDPCGSAQRLATTVLQNIKAGV